jgi:aminopeptidase N
MSRRYQATATPRASIATTVAAMRQLLLRAAPALVAVLLLGCTTPRPGPGTEGSTSTPTTTTDGGPDSTTGPTTTPPPPGPIGDPYFPELGSTGFDVEHYDLTMAVDPETGLIVSATVGITATAVTTLPEIRFDLVGLEVVAARLDGAPVPTRREGAKLVVDPPRPIGEGASFVIEVDYRGHPEPFFIPGFDTRAGWVVTAEGIHVIAEPDGARTWFPANDHPTDKATFTFTVTVPEPFVAVANGTLVARTTDAGDTTSVWHMRHPMATYLATVVVGELEPVARASAGDVTIVDHLPSDLVGSPSGPLARSGEIIEFLETWFGPYPFSSYGHVVVPDLPFALETQTMTVIGRAAIDEATIVHEIAHQWFGNSVTPATWQDIWLSEGFASFGELLWIEHQRGSEAMLDEIRRRHTILAGRTYRPIADPGIDDMFGVAVYWRGALTLHALRTEIGDEAMRRVLTQYAERFADGNASTGDFIDVAEEVVGVDLADLFGMWLDRPELPPLEG